MEKTVYTEFEMEVAGTRCRLVPFGVGFSVGLMARDIGEEGNAVHVVGRIGNKHIYSCINNQAGDLLDKIAYKLAMN